MIETIEALTLLLYLLPGVVGYFLYELLVERKPTELSSKSSAIVTLTFFSVLISSAIFEQPILPSVDNSLTKSVPAVFEAFFGANFIWALAVAIVLGGAAAWIRNKNYIFKALKKLKITRQTGAIDPWHQVFQTERGKWCRITFKDGTELVGWPKFYSLHGENKQLFLANAVWFKNVDSKDNPQEKNVEGPGVLLCSFEEISAIEFLD